MAWLKTIDGDLINLDSGVKVYLDDDFSDYPVRLCSPKGIITYVCSGTKEENEQYMKDFEDGLLNADEIIIDCNNRRNHERNTRNTNDR